MLQKLFVVGCLWLAGGWAAAESPTYSLGVVPQRDAGALRAAWEPIVAEIGRSSGLQLRIVGAPSIGAFERAFEAGAYDFVYLNPYHAVVAQRVQGYVPLVRDVAEPLTGIIVVPKDSAVHTPAELAGQRVAFPSPNAFGAALVPRADFARRLHVQIEPWYVGTHGSVYLNVALGRAPAGGGIRRTLEEQPAEVRNALRVIYETPPLPTHPLAAHPRVPREVRERLTRALLGFEQSAHGRQLLEGIPIQCIGQASPAEYRALETLNLDAFYERE